MINKIDIEIGMAVALASHLIVAIIPIRGYR